MSQYSSASWPQASITTYPGNAGINAFPAGPKDSYLTLGGYLDSADANNNATDILSFGTVVSSLAGTGHQWAVGKASASYFYRGVAIFDDSSLQWPYSAYYLDHYPYRRPRHSSYRL
jgi:hypothetical protein